MVAALFLAASASIAAPSAKDAGERVLESFNVGEGVLVRALKIEEKSNTLWVGTSTGVHEIDLVSGNPRNSYNRENSGLANEYVFAIGIDNDGWKWFGTNAGGVARYRDGKWKTFMPLNGIADYWVYAFENGKDGAVWIGTWAGVSRFDPKTDKFTTYVKELINEWVYGIGVDSKGRVWFGTEGGMSMYDGKKWKSWSHKDGIGAPNTSKLPASDNTGLGTRMRHDLSITVGGKYSYNPSYIFCVHVAPDDKIWAGTWGGGITRFDGKRWTNLTTKNGLAGNIVYSIAQDKNGVMWIGTNNGLSRYDGKTWRTFGKKEGLLGSNVYAIAIAPNGNIWVGTQDGVARIGK
ncbi:MAG: two-component regulator propeller domain-containing protein [Pseudomonadota bacterium]